jgi:Mg2+ and Co2+ transporter CorA
MKIDKLISMITVIALLTICALFVIRWNERREYNDKTRELYIELRKYEDAVKQSEFEKDSLLSNINSKNRQLDSLSSLLSEKATIIKGIKSRLKNVTKRDFTTVSDDEIINLLSNIKTRD